MTDFNLHADMTDAQAREKAADIAAEQTDSLDMLVAPDDIQDGVDSWDDVTRTQLLDEANRSADIMVGERQPPYDVLIHDLATVLQRNDMVRAPMKHLAFDSKEEAVKQGYWPYEMNRTRVTELLTQHDPHLDYWEEARQTVTGGIVEGLIDI